MFQSHYVALYLHSLPFSLSDRSMAGSGQGEHHAALVRLAAVAQ